jgi:uncharacterized protein (UPF0248 family)
MMEQIRTLYRGTPFDSWGKPVRQPYQRPYWPIFLQFKNYYNRTWADVSVRVRDREGNIDQIEFDEGYYSPTTLCMIYWDNQAPKHFAWREFLCPDPHRERPWYHLKCFATSKDFLPAVRARWIEGRIFHDAQGHWHTLCKLYHDYLTWRGYWATELGMKAIAESDTGASWEQWVENFKKLLGNPDTRVPFEDSDNNQAPDLRKNYRVYTTREFYKKVLAAWQWSGHPNCHELDGGFFEYRAPWRPP